MTASPAVPLRCKGIMRLPALLLLVLLALAAPATSHAAKPKPLTDCARNDGVVAGKHSVKALKAAYRAIPVERRISDDCGQSIASHLAALRGLKGGRQAGAVLEDCTRHGGRLTQRFAPHALARAARLMSTARREQTRCLIGILSQLRARGRPVAVSTPPRRSAVKGPYAEQSGFELREALAPFTAALRRNAEPSDGVPENVLDELVRRNEERDAGYDVFSVRRVGPGDTAVWLVTANGKMCAMRWYGDTIAPDFMCLNANRWAKGEGLLDLRPHSDATHDVWGVIPDGFDDGTLLFGRGDRTRPLETTENGVLDQLEELPARSSGRLRTASSGSTPRAAPASSTA